MILYQHKALALSQKEFSFEGQVAHVEGEWN